MTDAVELWQQPEAKEINMIVGWRQWADAGSVSSGLPQYIIEQLGASQIGRINSHGFYIFQVPGTHDLMRPVVQFVEGYPEQLDQPVNEIYYSGSQESGLILFLGDEPNLDVERYIASLIQVAKIFHVKRIVGMGGVYGELPYDKERSLSCSYSLPRLKEEVQRLAVKLSDYHGGASIDSILCKRAGDADMEYVGLYAFVPVYDLSSITQTASVIRLDNDYPAWLGVMRRVNHLLKLHFDLSDLEQRSQQLINVVDQRINEIHESAPQLGIREYFNRLSDSYEEQIFNPLDDIWEEELKRLLNKFDEEE